MCRRRYLAISIGCLVTLATAAAQVPDDPLADVARLYASASFEDALAVLGRVGTQADANQVDEYRALCFLGLNRTRDAEQAVERLVMRRRPPASYDVAGFPPKFVTLYRDVKKRTLPAAAMALYDSAKATFEEGQFVTASAQFKELLVLLSDPDAEGLADLRRLTDGFSQLSEQRLLEAGPPAPRVHEALAAEQPLEAWPQRSATLAGPPAMTWKEAYTSEDLDVVPPMIIDQRMPAWIPPNPFLATQTFRGALELIVGSDGAVESRSMSVPVFTTYDWELLRAAARWKYRPATRNGQPVKYRKIVAITLVGSTPRSPSSGQGGSETEP